VADGGEAGHLGADLGGDLLGADEADPGDLIQLGLYRSKTSTLWLTSGFIE
jgi:hypothetical protein